MIHSKVACTNNLTMIDLVYVHNQMVMDLKGD